MCIIIYDLCLSIMWFYSNEQSSRDRWCFPETLDVHCHLWVQECPITIYDFFRLSRQWTLYNIIDTGWWLGTCILFFHILGISSSQLTKSYFSEGFKPPTSIYIYIIWYGKFIDTYLYTYIYIYISIYQIMGNYTSLYIYIYSNVVTTIINHPPNHQK